MSLDFFRCLKLVTEWTIPFQYIPTTHTGSTHFIRNKAMISTIRPATLVHCTRDAQKTESLGPVFAFLFAAAAGHCCCHYSLVVVLEFLNFLEAGYLLAGCWPAECLCWFRLQVATHTHTRAHNRRPQFVRSQARLSGTVEYTARWLDKPEWSVGAARSGGEIHRERRAKKQESC